jgi:hypothetical protein
MGHLFLESDNYKTEILSAWRYKKKEFDDYNCEYGYILFCQDVARTELELEDGTIDTNVWQTAGEIYETYINTNRALKIALESYHRIPLFKTYKDAFWKVHKYEYESLSKLYKGPHEYFDAHSKYAHLDK